MLDDAVAGFLDNASERQLDEPLLALLRARGYAELHLTHGTAEFGKDIIGQRDGDQWAFQSKAGDIGQTAWRQMTGQLDELRTSNLSHPGFRSDLDRRSVLLLSGRLKGNAPLSAQEYNARARERGEPELEVWGRDRLLGELAGNPDALLRGSVDGQLLGVLGAVEADEIDIERIELFSRRWTTWDPNRIASVGIVEAAVVCEALARSDRLDLACQLGLCLVRGAVASSVADVEAGKSAMSAAGALFETYAQMLWAECDERLLRNEGLVAYSRQSAWVTYQVRCMRIAEIVALLAIRLRERDRVTSLEMSDWLASFTRAQPGVARPLSDQYAVGLIPLAVALREHEPELGALLTAATVWLCDRNEKGRLGVADLNASQDEEIARVLMSGVGAILAPRRSSLIGSVLLDLAAIAGMRELYADIHNDLAAVRLHCPVLIASGGPSRFTNPCPEARWDFSVDYAEELGDDPPAHHLDASVSDDDFAAAGHWWELLAASAALRDRWFVPAIRAAVEAPSGVLGSSKQA